ncbi:MAG TPA: hypothetical protein VIP70_12615 [Nitrososphaeraceae archaeon]
MNHISSSSSSNHLIIHTDLSKEQLDCCLIRLLEERKQKIVEDLSEVAIREDA